VPAPENTQGLSYFAFWEQQMWPGASEDTAGYAEESVTAAAYDENVVDIIGNIVLSDEPGMEPSDFLQLKQYLEDIYGLRGDDLTRAMYRCAQNIKRSHGISRMID
jgi:hypothetical protein